MRSGIKRQVERESIPWLEWEKVCGYLQGSRQTRSNCGRLSLLISLPCFFCNSTGNPAVRLWVCLHAHFTSSFVLSFLSHESSFQMSFYSIIAFALLWTNTQMNQKISIQRKYPWYFQCWQNNLMHGRWQQHQQYLHAGIGPSPLSEVTHRPWITLPCSGVLWSRGLTVWPLLNVVSLSPLTLLPFPSPHIPTNGPVT